MDLDLKGVHVLVTGASGGIGLDITRIFLEQGANVTAHFRSSDATLQPLREVYDFERLRTARASLSHEPDVQVLLDSISSSNSSFGPVEILIVNHGAYTSADVPLQDMTLQQWNDTMNGNLTSSFLVAREYLRGLSRGIMSRGKGARFGERAAIILVGSTAGKYGEAGHADYSACKSAIMYGLTMSLKNEIVKIAPNARVNCIAPGWTKTPMAEEALQQPMTVYRALATTPLKKVAEPEDIANQIVLLASSKVSGHVTGQVLMIEGGMEGRLLNMPKDLELPGEV
ncbi:hypothetical protein HETIRDRAFT_103744 [Heterobasidion irregulare TC 32-1]|uniref:Uncharacterized protein n=1 Tax=Heterobasidion irregulare (strain TC 32-1) TaxID=747525 RepID=W4K1D5_HETIT|nr:uncharacterized protein HETIRDRAFT_103744 [Heterobasidion irregulare TC 32-1]ETW79622.1 hypothetical protein HETIRDRAFT_103744 [Heterobasidion irregulare TC 32-1]